jgi:hypothetical protein
MDAAWGHLWDEAAIVQRTVTLGAVQTDLVQLPGYPGRCFVAASVIPAAYEHPSAATWKRYAQRGLLISEQPGGPNTLRWVEVAQNPGGDWEPVWSV